MSKADLLALLEPMQDYDGFKAFLLEYLKHDSHVDMKVDKYSVTYGFGYVRFNDTSTRQQMTLQSSNIIETFIDRITSGFIYMYSLQSFNNFITSNLKPGKIKLRYYNDAYIAFREEFKLIQGNYIRKLTYTTIDKDPSIILYDVNIIGEKLYPQAIINNSTGIWCSSYQPKFLDLTNVTFIVGYNYFARMFPNLMFIDTAAKLTVKEYCKLYKEKYSTTNRQCKSARS